MQSLHAAVFLSVCACWLATIAGFLIRKRQSGARELVRSPRWKIGLALQAASIFFVWALPRRRFTPFVPTTAGAQVVLAVLTVALAVLSAWMLVSAKRALGRQWAYQARIIQDHQLVMHGPYRLVRHPIYTALFGLSLATALSYSRPVALVPFGALFALGTLIRVRGEERLLRSAFGKEFEAYARRVRAVIPGIL